MTLKICSQFLLQQFNLHNSTKALGTGVFDLLQLRCVLVGHGEGYEGRRHAAGFLLQQNVESSARVLRRLNLQADPVTLQRLSHVRWDEFGLFSGADDYQV